MACLTGPRSITSIGAVNCAPYTGQQLQPNPSPELSRIINHKHERFSGVAPCVWISRQLLVPTTTCSGVVLYTDNGVIIFNWTANGLIALWLHNIHNSNIIIIDPWQENQPPESIIIFAMMTFSNQLNAGESISKELKWPGCNYWCSKWASYVLKINIKFF